jgi:hypothetical protein
MDIGVAAWIAATGPLAEAVWLQQSDTQDDLDDKIFDDYLVGVLYAGGRKTLKGQTACWIPRAVWNLCVRPF